MAEDAQNPPTQTPEPAPSTEAEEFAEMADERQPSFLAEFVLFIRSNKKWWLTPIFVILLLLIALVIISQTPLAPFIYPFF